MPKNDKTSRRENLVEALLHDLGHDIESEHLKETPRRFVALLEEFSVPKPFSFTTFIEPGSDEMIVQGKIPVVSLCAHHLCFFWGHATVGYLPDKDRIVGLSKLARVVAHYSRQLQVQERITHQVADYLMKQLRPKGVGVIIQATHSCQNFRGIQSHEAFTNTVCLRGVFKTDPSTRSEFLSHFKA